MTARKRIDNLVPQSPEVREVDDSDTEVNEGSSLLGAGTQSDYDEAARAPRKGSWNGFEDFEGLPWWKTPSVRVFTDLQRHLDAPHVRSPSNRGHRSTGCSYLMPSSLWHLVVS